MKIKRGIRRNVFVKSAICFFIFYMITMISLTQLLASSYVSSIQTEFNYCYSNMQSRLQTLVSFNDSEYTILNSNIAMSNFIQRLSNNNIFGYAALKDENSNEICNTGNLLIIKTGKDNGEEMKLILLDKIMTENQINQMSSTTHNGVTFSVTVTGEVRGTEIVPEKIIIYDIYDNNQILFQFHNEVLSNLELVTFDSKTTSAMPEIIKELENKKYEKVKNKVNSFIGENLKPIMEGRGTSLRQTTSIFNSSFISYDILNKPKTDERYFLAYSYEYSPIKIAMEQLTPLYIFCFIITIILTLVLSSKLSGWIVKPILILNKAAIKMTNGEKNASYDVGTKRHDEISQLANSLGIMSKNLNESMAKLEEDIDFRKASEQQRRELTNAIAHELKTPLGIIRSYSEGLKENIAEDKKDYYLEVIINETEQMDKMVLEMLDLSKLEANAYKLKLEQFSLKALTQNEIERYKSLLEEKKITLNFNCDNECEIIADQAGLQQVISNFISNAIKHTPSGMNIEILIEDIDEKVNFLIENQGENIPQDQLLKIWDSFYKVDDSRDRTSGGTGLGLSIAKNYLILHKAQYGCENTIDGVKFWFSISLKDNNCNI